MNTKIKHFILIIFSLILALATLFIQTKLENKNEVGSAKLGYPAYFLEQNFSAKYEKHYFFPTWEKIDISGKSPIVGFRPAGLLADWVMILLVLELAVYALETVDFAIRKEKK